jgi:hypothetical protein
VPLYSVFCLNNNSIVMKVYICNASATDHTYDFSFHGLPSTGAGSGCDVAGPTTFTPSSGTATVPAGSCAAIYVTIDRPVDLTALGLRLLRNGRARRRQARSALPRLGARPPRSLCGGGDLSRPNRHT